MQKGEFLMAKINYPKWSHMQEQYMQMYQFLGLKNERWSILFEKIENKLDTHQIDYDGARYLLDRYFKCYIDKEIEEGRTRIINNLLILIKKKNAQITYLFSEFFKAIHSLSIEIPEEYYIKLKEESVILQRMLAEADLGRVSFQNLESSYQKIALLLSFKPVHVSFGEVKKIYEKYEESLDEVEKEKLAFHLKDASYSLKFKYLIIYDKVLEGIYAVYCQEIEKIFPSSFYRAILCLSLEHLKYVVAQYQQNQSLSITHLKNQDYLCLIANHMNQKVFINSLNNHSVKEKVGKMQVAAKKKGKRSSREIYTYFQSIKPNLTEEDKKVIDTLFSCLSKKSQEGIEGYIQGIYQRKEPIGKKADSDIQKLKYHFKKYLVTGRISKPFGHREIYDCFLSIKPNLTEEDRHKIDALFSALPQESQEGIIGYLKEIYHQKDSIGKRANRDIQVLRENFKKYLRTEDTSKKKDLSNMPKIYSYFISIKPKLTTEDKKVIDILFSCLSKEKQQGIKEYVQGIDEQNSSAYFDIEKLKKQFQNIYSIRLLKYQALVSAMIKIEKSFYQLGLSFEEYQDYKQSLEQKIRNRGITNLFAIMRVFIIESYDTIKQMKERQNLVREKK